MKNLVSNFEESPFEYKNKSKNNKLMDSQIIHQDLFPEYNPKPKILENKCPFEFEYNNKRNNKLTNSQIIHQDLFPEYNPKINNLENKY